MSSVVLPILHVVLTCHSRRIGFNIESMDKFFPISSFDAVYLVDLCEPLLEVARKRFARRGWKNVHVICADAASFVLPEPGWTNGREPKGSISFVTLSYSLSMVRVSASNLLPSSWTFLSQTHRAL